MANLDIRDLPEATAAELQSGKLFLAPTTGARQNEFLGLLFETLINTLSGESIASGGSAPAQDSGIATVGQVYFQVLSGKVVNMFFSPRDSVDWIGIGTGASTYYVRDSDVAVGSNSAAGTYYTVTVDEVESYDRGLIVRFRNPIRNLGPVKLRVEGMQFRDVWTIREEEFSQYEFHPNFLHSLLYDGDRWVALDAIDIPLLILDDSDFQFDRSANRINIDMPDNVLIAQGIAQILFQMNGGPNTDDVTIRLQGGPPIALLTSRGDQIPPGYLEDGMYVRAVLDVNQSPHLWISDVEGPRPLRHQLVATLDIPDGVYDSFNIYVGGWQVESGVQGFQLFQLTGGTYFGNPDDVPDVFLQHPANRLSNAQLGWFIELRIGDVVDNTVLILFGATTAFATGIVIGENRFFLNYQESALVSGATGPVFSISTGNAFTIPDGSDYNVRIYSVDN